MKLNVAPRPIRTHEGAVAKHINPELQLRRSVMACMLWESEFYEDGSSVAARIKDTIPQVPPAKVAAIAIEAREKMKLRHVPLLIVREMARLETHKGHVEETLARVIQRPDELAEFVSIYFKDKRQPLSAQVKRGLAKAFQKFDGYALAKYNRDGAVKLRDVLFMCHAKPKDDGQAGLWKALIDGTLATPDTWEVALSGGADKKETWTRLLAERKLGALALLRNLRNMVQANVPVIAIREALIALKPDRVLPFRFIAAAMHAPQFEPQLEQAMFKCIAGREPFSGRTALLIDHSGSMQQTVSDKSEITRFDAAAAVAMLLRESNPDTRVFTFSDYCIEVPPRRGFALRDAIKAVVNPVGTMLGSAVRQVYSEFPECNRVIVITDEQSHDPVPDPQGRGYVINVATARNGVGYGPWVHIDGWSEAVLDFISIIDGSPTIPAETS